MPMLANSGSVQITPKIYYRDDYTATVVAKSKNELQTWWNQVKSTKPFDELAADRNDIEPYKCTLRPISEYPNEERTIVQIFRNALVTCHNLPPADLVGFILANLDKTYEIQGRSYQIISLISNQGCYGDVFLARDQKSNEKVAIKIFRIKGYREDRVLKKLAEKGNHLNIVKYIASEVIMGKTWIVMEYIDGVMLDKYKGEWTTELEKQYKSALSFIRSAGIETERENKSENTMIMFIDGKPTLKLIDFGTLAVA